MPQVRKWASKFLQGNTKNEWNTIKSTVALGSQNVNALNERVFAFKRIFVPNPLAIDVQRDYLQRVRKNDKLTVPQFLDLLKHINMLISHFPSASEDDIFTTNKIKQIFYHSMPLHWRTNFVNLAQRVQQVTIKVLRTYGSTGITNQHTQKEGK